MTDLCFVLSVVIVVIVVVVVVVVGMVCLYYASCFNVSMDVFVFD